MDNQVDDLVAYIMALWDQQKRHRMVQNYNGAIKINWKG